MAYYSFLDNLRKNKPITVFNKGLMKRDFTYIDDVVTGIINLMNLKLKENHLVLNIGKGKSDNLMDLVNLLQNNYNKKFKIIYSKKFRLVILKKHFQIQKKQKNL